MIDAITKKPLYVATDSIAGPYIRLPASQLDEIGQLLQRHGIRHWVDEEIISLNEGPYFGIINLGRGGDAEAVQAILDDAR